jgi:hypothetical protein
VSDAATPRPRGISGGSSEPYPRGSLWFAATRVKPTVRPCLDFAAVGQQAIQIYAAPYEKES